MQSLTPPTSHLPRALQITEKKSTYVKNYGIWMKYNSRSGTHNMYREYRDVKLTNAIDTMYQDMAGRHRTRGRSIQIIGTTIVADADCKRITTTQFHDSSKEGVTTHVKFPLPHRIMRAANKNVKSTYLASRPSTHFN